MTTDVDTWRSIWKQAPPGHAATTAIIHEATERGQRTECLTALLAETRAILDDFNTAHRTNPDTPKSP